VPRESEILKFTAHHRIEILMWILIAEILVSPIADTHPRTGLPLGLLVLVTVFYAARHMATSAAIRKTVLSIAVVWMLTRILEAFSTSDRLYAHLSPMVGLAFSISVLWAIFEHFRVRSTDWRSAIAEAFIGYLVIATAFSQLYWILNRFVDQAFNVAIASTQSAELLYFSMVTLTTVGYGGIHPQNPYVRMVAAFESMYGIFFVAVVVARLVASYRPDEGSAGRYSQPPPSA